MKKLFACLALALAIVLTFTACSLGEAETFANWDISGTLTNSRGDNNWRVSVERAHGSIYRNITLDAEQLAVFQILSQTIAGTATLTLSQDNAQYSVDLTESFIGAIDLRDEFVPGLLRMQLDFDHAQEVFVLLDWQTYSASLNTEDALIVNHSVNSLDISAAALDGNLQRDIMLDVETLAALRIESSNSAGSVRLILRQTGVERVLNLNGMFNVRVGDEYEVIDFGNAFAQEIDLNDDRVDDEGRRDFVHGSTRVRLEFRDAQDVNISISW